MAESVYDIIKEVPAHLQKGKMYQSSRKGRDIPPTCSTFGTHGTSVTVGNVGGYSDNDVPCAHPAKKSFGAFGRTALDDIDSKNYLKMTGNRGVLPDHDVQRFERAQVVEKRAVIPKKEDKPIMGLKSDKNYIVANAVENSLAVPKKKAPGAAQRGVERVAFGKVPEYVTARKGELASERNDRDNAAAQQAQDAELFTPMPGCEIKDLKQRLQARWDTVNREFQTMGFQVETKSKKRRQEQLEVELRTLEAGIDKVTREKIFVFED